MDGNNKTTKMTKKRNLIVTSYFADTGKSVQSLVESYILQEASKLL